MAVNSASGLHVDGAGVKHTEVFVATVNGPAYITRIDVQGYVNAATTFGNLATGGISVYNLAAGVQFGNAGYTVVPITNGSAAGVNWFTWGDMLPPALANQYLAGASPIGYGLAAGFALTTRLRQYMYVSSAIDVYVCVGENTALGSAFNFEASFTYRMEWATYP